MRGAVSQEQQKAETFDLKEAEELFKDFHMKGRAVRIDETPEEYQREREESWGTAWEQIKQEKGWEAAEDEPVHPEEGTSEEVGGGQAEDVFKRVPAERRELARTLAAMTQEEYAEWLTKNMLEETSVYNQLVTRPEYRALTSQERADLFIAMRQEPEYAQYQQRIDELDQFWLLKKKLGDADGVRTVGSGSKWSNFEINKGTVGEHAESKGYLTFKNPAEKLTPANVTAFMQRLKEAGYNGQVKVPVIASGLIFRFDNIVFHGDTDEDTEKALQIAREMFGEALLQTQKGVDGENAEGKHTSYSDLLAEKVQMARNAKNN